MPPSRINILGINVNDVNMRAAVSRIDDLIGQGSPTYVCVTGAHGIIESQSDEHLQEIHNNAGLVVPDGISVVWLSRLLGHTRISRVPGPDLMPVVCGAFAEKGYRHFLFGSADGVPERLRDELCRRNPGLNVVGTFSPPFRPMTPEEDQEVIDLINAAEPDILWVGLSTPKQERWMAAHLGKLRVPVMIGVGAAFDLNAGLKARAPLWIQSVGCEWLYRMVTEPQRLGRRYLHIVPRFLYLALLQATGMRRYKHNK
jgi:N-acetylglucosaminyldiphosphoundecaprenol N-acetyl-beta-D-mannosaminyltransferase